MTQTQTTETINRPLATRESDEFYVHFLRIDDNASNLLGRQVRIISRPEINMNSFDLYQKNKKQNGIGMIDFGEISITFNEDNEGLVNKVLYTQIQRQVGHGGMDNNFQAAAFDIHIKMYNKRDEVIQIYKMTNCLIKNISGTELDVTDTTPTTLSVSVSYDNLDMEFPRLGGLDE